MCPTSQMQFLPLSILKAWGVQLRRDRWCDTHNIRYSGDLRNILSPYQRFRWSEIVYKVWHRRSRTFHHLLSRHSHLMTWPKQFHLRKIEMEATRKSMTHREGKQAIIDWSKIVNIAWHQRSRIFVLLSAHSYFSQIINKAPGKSRNKKGEQFIQNSQMSVRSEIRDLHPVICILTAWW